MLEFIAAVLSAMGMVPGILLRFVPFQDVMTKPQRRKLLVLYTLAWVLNFVGLFWNLRCHGMYMMANYLRYSSLLYAVVLSILNMLVIRGRVREHLFITGIVLIVAIYIDVLKNKKTVQSFIHVTSAAIFTL